MSLRIANRVFAPHWWAVLLAVTAIAAFVVLGNWQLQRSRDKQSLVDSFERGSVASVALGRDTVVGALPRYQQVRARGHYEPAQQVLIDNMPSQTGRPGYRVLTPLRRDNSDRLLLVDRGWVPLGSSRATLPAVDVDAELRTVSGRLDTLPAPGIRVGEAGVAGQTQWPRVLNFPRQADLEKALGAPVEARILLLDASEPDGFERAWRPAMQFGPERHLGYAVQWFAFAAAALTIFIALSLRRDDSGTTTAAMDDTP